MPSVTFTDSYSVSYWGSVTASVRVTFSESYNQNTNQTTLTLTGLEFKKNGSSTIGDIPVYGVLSVNGTTVCTIDNSGSGKKSSVNMDGDGWCAASLTNVTKTPVAVTHNADGTKSVSVSVAPGTNSRFCAQYAWYHQTGTDPGTGHAIYRTTYVPFGVESDSATMTLTTRPRITSVTATNANFGSAVTITLNRYNSAFKHTVKASCAGLTETVMDKQTTYPTVTWTPSIATYAPRITTAMSATATITCDTYNGNTLIGTSTTTCTLTFTSASVKPSVSIATADPTGLLSTYGKYVVGKSKVKVTLTNTLKYGATVTAIAITANGASYSSSPATTDFIASTSNTSVTAKITDSRGQTATASATIQIYGYTAPKINSASVYRCDSGGTANNTGAYFRVAYNVAITDLGNHNTKTLTVKYKKRSASSYSSSSITMSSYSQSGNSSVIAADVNSTYDVQLVLADAFGSATVTMSLPTAETRMNFGTGQNGGVAVGKVSEYNKTFEVAQSWTVRTGNIISEKAGNAMVMALNSLTGIQLNLDTGAGANHGIYSYGYYDGSSFHSSAGWMIYRDGAGNVIVNGRATGNVLKTGDTINGSYSYKFKCRDTSHYSIPIFFENETPSSFTYKPHIGFHNTGGPSGYPGVFNIIPYGTNASPWGRADGLSISHDNVKFNGSELLLETNAWTKLWTNSSPTSAFAAQDVTIPSGYNAVYVVAQTSRTSGEYVGALCISGLTTYIQGFWTYKFARTAKLSGTKVTFGGGYGGPIADSMSASNDYIIPKYIYGIRGVPAP